MRQRPRHHACCGGRRISERLGRHRHQPRLDSSCRRRTQRLGADAAALLRDPRAHLQLEQVQPEPPSPVVHRVGHLAARATTLQRDRRASQDRRGRWRSQPLVLPVRRLRTPWWRRTPVLTLCGGCCARGGELNHVRARQRRLLAARGEVASAQHLRDQARVHAQQARGLALRNPPRLGHSGRLTRTTFPQLEEISSNACGVRAAMTRWPRQHHHHRGNS